MVTSSDMVPHQHKLYEYRRIQLTSPILHIGSEVQRLNPFEYVQTAEKVYIPNQEALARTLHKRGYLQAPKPWQRIKDLQNSGKALSEYTKAIKDKDDAKVQEIIEQCLGKEWWKAKDEYENTIFPEYGIVPKWFKHRINNELRPMIRNGFGQLYIPGSSIKGAIRTAIAYYMLKHQPERVSAIEQTLRERLKTPGKISNNKKKLGNELFMKDLFSKFLLIYQNREFNTENESNTDFMRAVKVTDCAPLSANEVMNLVVIAEVIVSSFSRSTTSSQPPNSATHRASIYAEMVHNVQTEFTLSIDIRVDENKGITEGMLSWFSRSDGIEIPFKTVEDILSICKEFSQAQWDYERDYWQRIKNNRVTVNDSVINLDFDLIREFYKDSECPFDLRLGWASGMLGTTIGLHFNDQTRRGICDECGSPHNRRPGFEAPKSRRTVVNQNGDIEFAPGWVKLTVLK